MELDLCGVINNDRFCVMASGSSVVMLCLFTTYMMHNLRKVRIRNDSF
jgi:hypothetical protein